MSADSRIDIALTIVAASRDPYDVHLSAAADTPWHRVRDALRASGRDVPESLWRTDEPIGQEHLLRDLVHGDVLSSHPVSSGSPDLLAVECSRGPQVGARARIDHRTTTIGRHPGATFRLHDPDVSRLHCQVRLVAGRVSVRDLDSTNGTRIDGETVGSQERELRAGGSLRVGNSTLNLSGPYRPGPNPADGWVQVQRSPVHLVEPSVQRLTEPSAPRANDRRSLPWVLILLPLFIGVGLALLMDAMLFLAFALFSPVMMLAQHLTDKRDGRRLSRRDRAEYSAALQRFRSRADSALAHELLLRERIAPPLVDAIRSVHEVDGRLWHRRPARPGWLHWRIGNGEVESLVVVTAADGEEVHPTLSDAPVTVDLGQHRLVGVHGPTDMTDRLFEGLLLQTCAWHSPQQLRIAVVGSSADQELGWLPHVQPSTGEPADVLPADRPEEIAAFVRSLPLHASDDARSGGARLLLLIRDARSACASRELAPLLENPSLYSATVVVFAESVGQLPDRAFPVVEALSEAHCAVRGDHEVHCVPDLLAPNLLSSQVRRFACLRDAAPEPGTGRIPASVTLPDAWAASTGAVLLDAQVIAANWQRRRPDMTAVLGMTGEGALTVDLTQDGPHALIAGTTGAGKSELLQTLVVSLAAGNRPDALNFVLVDYKGGAAFRECARLPHTVGMVTDLDSHLTERALDSLSAELHRRERVLASVGAKDLDDYHRDPANPTLARLVIVIDEFRVLAEELPDFVDGLVRLATVGRSLGVHLVLATQRPAGIVSSDIRANINLRIALRVRDDGDSQDVIECADAARVPSSLPGRGFLRCGGGPVRPFQTARSTLPPVDRDSIVVAERGARQSTVVDGAGPTVLSQLVDLLDHCAHVASVEAPASPWLPPLPDLVRADDLEGCPVTITSECGSGYPFGRVDRPRDQAQPAVAWHPPSDQHLAVIGGPRSGRSTAIRTVLGSAMSVDAEVHAYVFDFGHSLADLSEWPGVGAVVSADEPARVERVLGWIVAEIADRRRQGHEGRPRIVLAVDGWDVLVDLADDSALFRLLDLAGEVLRDGTAADVHVVATGGRGLLTSRSLAAFRSQLVLAMPDRDDIASTGVPRDSVPAAMPPGRALVVPDGLEVQIALPSPDRVFRTARPPVRLAPVPAQVEAVDRVAGVVVLGVGTDGPVGPSIGRRGDLLALVAGPPRSGRSTTLVAATRALGDRPICWIGTDDSITLPQSCFLPETGSELADWLATNPSGGVLVDDVGHFLETDVEELLIQHASRSAATGALIVASGDPVELATNYRGLVGELRRRGTGVLLMPTRTDGELFGMRCPRLDRPRPGNGFLVERGEFTELQIAHPTTESAQARLIRAP